MKIGGHIKLIWPSIGVMVCVVGAYVTTVLHVPPSDQPINGHSPGPCIAGHAADFPAL